MRNRIAHGYEDVQPKRIWDTIQNDLPPLRTAVERLLSAFAPPMTAARRFGPALEALHVFIAWTAPVVEGFPRGAKFTLGDRIAATGLDALERLIEATYDRDRAKPLAAANLAIEKLRHLFRLAFTLKCIDERRYEHAARNLDEIGRLIGAWKKSSAAHDARAVPNDGK